MPGCRNLSMGDTAILDYEYALPPNKDIGNFEIWAYAPLLANATSFVTFSGRKAHGCIPGT